MNVSRLSLSTLNTFDEAQFVAVCGPLFEHSPWIAQRAFADKPFKSFDQLHATLVSKMQSASEHEQLSLLNAHPDLVGRLAREGQLTRESTAEQSAAGLSGLSAGDIEAFDRYNAGYRERFGFPFIICARENKKDAILSAFPVRLKNTRDAEIKTALAEVAKIARLRLLDRVYEDDANMAHLTDNAYGKSGVRLTKVQRHADRHELFEFDVAIQLRGDFTDTYMTGSNANVIPTDTMKNTVYALAAQTNISSAEQFAEILASHFVRSWAHVSSAQVTIHDDRWKRIRNQQGEEHPHAFVSGGSERRLTRVVVDRTKTTLTAGIEDLVVLKTTNSAFTGYIRDRYTTLPETTDRIFATSVNAEWDYDAAPNDFNAAHHAIREAMIAVFARHKSDSVQQTMLEMGRAAIDVCPELLEVRLRLPNQHRIPMNLVPFGLENRNEVFVTTSEPYGDIRATIRRN